MIRCGVCLYSSRVISLGNLCNNSWVDEHGKYAGQPTDIALLDVVIRSGLLDERPVSSTWITNMP
jgi:hypothetical protein